MYTGQRTAERTPTYTAELERTSIVDDEIRAVHGLIKGAIL